MTVGDLSLSQSLGGLRIANPDTNEDANASPSPPPPLNNLSSAYDPPSARPPAHAYSHSSASTVLADQHANGLQPTLPLESSGQESGIGFDAASYTLQHDRSRQSDLTHRSSQMLSQTAQQQAAAAAASALYASHPAISRRAVAQQSNVARPSGGMYNLQNASTSSASSQQPIFGYRGDIAASSYGSASELSRAGSRSSRQQPQQQQPQTVGDRVYRQMSQSNGAANGPTPPSRNSRRSHTVTAASNEPDSIGQHGGYGSAGATPPSNTAEDWRERGAAVGIKAEVDASGQTVLKSVKKGVKDFNFGQTLGEGSYSTVLAATDRQTLKEYAIKVLDKRHIIKEKKVKYVNIERDTLNRLTEHPGIVRLYYTFQDERSLYFVLDLASGGELLGVLKKLGTFDVECTRYYAAQILDSIAYMHSRGVIHRDLKPENVLLNHDMHVKITDFGTAKILKQTSTTITNNESNGADPMKDMANTELDRAASFVGTAEYVSPELLRDKSACKASDLWAFGCILFQLLAGRPPFKAANEYLTFQKILGLEYVFPDGFPEQARDLVERLLVLDPAARLTIEHIRSHPFFDGVTWGRSLWRQKAPRLKAYVPPPAPPIKLNGTGGDAAAQHKQQPTRPQLRHISDLPPPSQLDIDWSAVLTQSNERILKLGNLVVGTLSQPFTPSEPSIPNEKPKFSRFFSSNMSKKRERLVLITSAARIIIAAAGGNEKKAKMEITFAGNDATWKEFVDAKGLTGWTIDIKDKHYTFEDPSATIADPAGSKYSTKEWLESLDHAMEFHLADQQQSATTSYTSDSLFQGYGNGNSHADSVGEDVATPMSGPSSGHHLKQTLRRDTGESSMLDKGRKRFSKRHSKSGLAAVF